MCTIYDHYAVLLFHSFEIPTWPFYDQVPVSEGTWENVVGTQSDKVCLNVQQFVKRHKKKKS